MVMAQVSWMALVEKPRRLRIASNPSRFQNWKPTWTGPAVRCRVAVTRSACTVTRSAD